MASFLILGLGAAAMYLLHPEQRRRRRALLRDVEATPTGNGTRSPKAAARYGGPERRKDRSPYGNAERRASLADFEIDPETG
jgi:hypothetical protein